MLKIGSNYYRQVRRRNFSEFGISIRDMYRSCYRRIIVLLGRCLIHSAHPVSAGLGGLYSKVTDEILALGNLHCRVIVKEVEMGLASRFVGILSWKGTLGVSVLNLSFRFRPAAYRR